MAKTLNEAPITTVHARSKLPTGLHWRGIDPEVHLGYRKGNRGGIWLVRWRNGQGYKQQPIGTADDAIKEGTLDYNAAVRAARLEVETARAKAKALAEGPALTVQAAVETYIAARDARQSRRAGRTVRSDAASRLARYVLGQRARGKQAAIAATPLADVALYSLAEEHLATWQNALPAELKHTTKRRLTNDLKAALNAAYAANRKRLDAKFPTIIRHGLKAESADADEVVQIARESQILSDVQVAQLIRCARDVDTKDGWDGDLLRLIAVLAATGARFSQVARMRVSDFQRTQQRLMVPVSRKGRDGKIGSLPVPIGPDVLETLMPAVTGRAMDAPLLERWRYEQVAGTIQWQRSGRGPWVSASELTRPWHAIRTQAGLPDAIPYALRHTSIVRGIRANLPIRLVAALHDTSVQMIERHYSRWIADGLNELAVRAIVPLLPQEDSKVIQLVKAG